MGQVKDGHHSVDAKVSYVTEVTIPLVILQLGLKNPSIPESPPTLQYVQE